MSTAEKTGTGTLPSTLRLGLSRGGIELKQFFRERDSVVFTFGMPAFLLLLLATMFTDTFEDTGVTASMIFTASMIAAGIMSTTLVNLGIGVAMDREDGTLKRLQGLPTPKAAYFIGKIVLVLVATIAEVALLLALGVALYDVDLPSTGAKWFTFAWVFLLGTVACAALGIAISSLPRSGRSAGAVIMLPFIALQFVSGILFNPIKDLPSPLLEIGSLLPLKWMAQGFRSVFLPDVMVVQEVTGSWELGRTALVLGAWCVAGLALCLLTFRWQRRGEG
ncbi:MAG TPA: ABC transporter permease [Pseudonocardiaceae bacterium]